VSLPLRLRKRLSPKPTTATGNASGGWLGGENMTTFRTRTCRSSAITRVVLCPVVMAFNEPLMAIREMPSFAMMSIDKRRLLYLWGGDAVRGASLREKGRDRSELD
jgi:hypothetical protein